MFLWQQIVVKRVMDKRADPDESAQVSLNPVPQKRNPIPHTVNPKFPLKNFSNVNFFLEAILKPSGIILHPSDCSVQACKKSVFTVPAV